MNDAETRLIAAVSIDGHKPTAREMIMYHRKSNPGHWCERCSCNVISREVLETANAVYADWELEGLAERQKTKVMLDAHVKSGQGEMPSPVPCNQWFVRVHSDMA